MAEIIHRATLERQRRSAALIKERHEWGERYGHGYAEGWDDRAMRIIRGEQKRIAKALWDEFRSR